VNPAATSPIHSTVTGRGVVLCTQYEDTVVVVQARDKYGNQRESGGDEVDVQLVPVDDVTFDFVDKADGTYDVTFRVPLMTTYSLSLQLNRRTPDTEHISSHADIPSITGMGGVAAACLDVTALDVTGPGCAAAPDGADQAVCEAAASADGQTPCVFSAAVAEVVAAEGRRFGSPYNVQSLDPNRNNPITSFEGTFAFGDGLSSGTVGIEREFEIQAVSVNNRNQIKGGDNFTVVLAGPERIEAEVFDLEIGRYTVRYMVKLAGDYLMFIELQARTEGLKETDATICKGALGCNWVNVTSRSPDLPTMLRFLPGEITAPTCTAEGLAQTVTAGQTNLVNLYARDSQQNDIDYANTDAASKFSVTIDDYPTAFQLGRDEVLGKNTDGKATYEACDHLKSDNWDCDHYMLEYSLNIKGEYKLGIVYQIYGIADSPFAILVQVMRLMKLI
jgi:hypothetical protein